MRLNKGQASIYIGIEIFTVTMAYILKLAPAIALWNFYVVVYSIIVLMMLIALLVEGLNYLAKNANKDILVISVLSDIVIVMISAMTLYYYVATIFLITAIINSSIYSKIEEKENNE